jgi:hypothetical protein
MENRDPATPGTKEMENLGKLMRIAAFCSGADTEFPSLKGL